MLLLQVVQQLFGGFAKKFAMRVRKPGGAEQLFLTKGCPMTAHTLTRLVFYDRVQPIIPMTCEIAL